MFYFSPQQRFHTVQLKLNKMGSAGDAVCGRRSFRRRSIDDTEGHGSNKANTTSCGELCQFPDLISLMYGEARMQLYGAT
jgi:hypothetical protein